MTRPHSERCSITGRHSEWRENRPGRGKITKSDCQGRRGARSRWAPGVPLSEVDARVAPQGVRSPERRWLGVSRVERGASGLGSGRQLVCHGRRTPILRVSSPPRGPALESLNVALASASAVFAGGRAGPEHAATHLPLISDPGLRPPPPELGGTGPSPVRPPPSGGGPFALPRGSAPHCLRSVRQRYSDHVAHRRQQTTTGRKLKR